MEFEVANLRDTTSDTTLLQLDHYWVEAHTRFGCFLFRGQSSEMLELW